MFWICFPFKGKEITGALKNKQANKQTKTMNIWGKVLCLRKIQKNFDIMMERTVQSELMSCMSLLFTHLLSMTCADMKGNSVY